MRRTRRAIDGSISQEYRCVVLNLKVNPKFTPPMDCPKRKELDNGKDSTFETAQKVLMAES